MIKKNLKPLWARKAHDLYKGYILPPLHESHVDGGPTGNTKQVCLYCRKVFQQNYELDSCPVCKSHLYRVSKRARVPRKIANDREWNKFIRMFIPNRDLTSK